MDRDSLAKFRVALLGLGGICIAAGAVIAVYLAWLIFQLVEHPQEVAVIGYVVELGAKNLQAVQGEIEGQPFQLLLGQPAHLLLMLLVGALFLMAAASAAKALMAAGVNVIRAGMNLPEEFAAHGKSTSALLRPTGTLAHK